MEGAGKSQVLVWNKLCNLFHAILLTGKHARHKKADRTASSFYFMLLSKCNVNLQQAYKLWPSHNCPPGGRGGILGACTTKQPKQAKKSSHLSTLFHKHQRILWEQGGILTSNNVKPLQAQVLACNFNSDKVLTFPSHQQDFYGELILCMPPVKTIDSGKAPAPLSGICSKYTFNYCHVQMHVWKLFLQTDTAAPWEFKPRSLQS